MIKNIIIKTLLLSIIAFQAFSSESNVEYIFDDPNVNTFLIRIAKENKLNLTKLVDTMKSEVFDYSVIDLMEKPAEIKSWNYYKNILINNDRIAGGTNYKKGNIEALKDAEKKYGVPVNVIVSIIGIESTYGKIQLKRTAVKTLSTLAFKYPRRSQYFKEELKHLFILADKEGKDPLSYYGSYAGAIGIPQFMPSNIIKYGQDGNNDKEIDLMETHEDAIASVANYISKHGWIKNKKVAKEVRLNKRIPKEKAESIAALNPCDPKNFMTISEMKKYGVIFDKTLPEDSKAMFAIIPNEDTDAYIVFFENACPIFKYNKSLKYVASVALLADKIDRSY